MKSVSIQINKDDGTHLQAHRGTILNGIGNELIKFSIDETSFLLQLVSFTVDDDPLPCTCDHTHILAQGVSGAHSFHPHVIHDVTCLSVRCLSSFCLLSLNLSLLPFLFHCLPVLCPAQLPQCRHRRGLNPLHSHTMRNIAPWRYTILSQVMSPNFSTTSTTQRLLQ